MNALTCPKCGGPAQANWDSFRNEVHWKCRCGYEWNSKPLDTTPDHIAEDSKVTDADTVAKLRNVARVASAHCDGPGGGEMNDQERAAWDRHVEWYREHVFGGGATPEMNVVASAVVAADTELRAGYSAAQGASADTLRRLWRVATTARAFIDRPGNWDAELHLALDDLHGEPPQSEPTQNITDVADAFIRDEGRGNMRAALVVALVRMRAAEENVFNKCEQYDRLAALGEAVEAMPKGDALYHGTVPEDKPWCYTYQTCQGLRVGRGATPSAALGLDAGKGEA